MRVFLVVGIWTTCGKHIDRSQVDCCADTLMHNAMDQDMCPSKVQTPHAICAYQKVNKLQHSTQSALTSSWLCVLLHAKNYSDALYTEVYLGAFGHIHCIQAWKLGCWMGEYECIFIHFKWNNLFPLLYF